MTIHLHEIALLLILAFTMPTHADPTFLDKTARMSQIEKKFDVVIGAILRSRGHEDYWVFFEIQPSATFGFIPIAVPKNATDRDFEIARGAAENTACFYDDEIKRDRAKPAASPSPSAFTVPTRTPEVLDL